MNPLVWKDDITVYSYIKQASTGLEWYKKTVIPNCFWDEDSVTIFRKTGEQIIGNVTLFIPYNPQYLTPAKWNAPSEKDSTTNWTLELGTDRRATYIVRGECPFQFTWGNSVEMLEQIQTFEDLYPRYKRVKDVNEQFYGRPLMWHLEVRC